MDKDRLQARKLCLEVAMLVSLLGSSTAPALEPAIGGSAVARTCPDLTGRYSVIGEPLPGSRQKSRFNSKLTVANVAIVGGNEFILEDQIPHFDLLQTTTSIAVDFRALDGTSKHFEINGAMDEISCTTQEVAIKKSFESYGERSSGHTTIVTSLSREKRALIIKTDMMQSTRFFFMPIENPPEAYYARFMRIDP